MTTIEVLATPRAPGARRIAEQLRRHAVPFQWRNIDDDLEARRLVDRARGTGDAVPYAVSIDGELFAAPAEATVRDRLGLPIESAAAAFRAFATGAAESIVVPRGGGAEAIVSAVDSTEITVCATVVNDQLWLGVGENRLLALHRLLSRLRAGDGALGEDRGYGPPAFGLAELLTQEQPLIVPLSA